ncbi:ScbR family autoregulator-binding transcription factor [Streptomyces sp. CAU 1734]|uniref:ScbR family autoregulator-binding transcription factor n=1 Tax=Streptomyces sp. CAU 1734 TaxID=3140360 RepID=UPI003261CA69
MIKQERAVRTRRALIESAAEAFGVRGYTEATLHMISAGAGVSTGALHFHFENKAAVAAAVERTAARALRAAACAVYAERSSALQALADASHVLARALARDAVVRAGLQLGREATYAPEFDLRGEWHRYVLRLLGEAEGEGALLPGLCRGHAAAMVVATTIGFEALGQHDRTWISRRMVTGFWELTLPCLATPEALRGLDPAGRHAAAGAAECGAAAGPVAGGGAVAAVLPGPGAAGRAEPAGRGPRG